MSNFFASPWTVAYQGPLSMEFSRQEYWSGLPFPSPGDIPDPGIEHVSPALAGKFFATTHQGHMMMELKYKPRKYGPKAQSTQSNLH